MSQEEVGRPRAASPHAAEGVPHLSSQDIHRLTTYKWRYSLESHGFSSAQAARLLFMKWLYGNGAVHS